MTIPLISANATNQLWWGITNQAIGVINQLTDGILQVNGAIQFTNSQFSIAAAAINVANSLIITSPSGGNTLFLQSSNASINGTLFLTGASGRSTSLYVANDSTFQGNVTISQNLTANNITINNIDHLGTVYANGSGVSVYVANNTVLSGNLMATGQNTYISNLNAASFKSQNIGVGTSLDVGSSFDATATAVFSNVSTTVANTLNVTGATTFGNGITVTNGLTTDTLQVNNGMTVAGAFSANGPGWSANVQNNLFVGGAAYINDSLNIIDGNYGVILNNDGVNGYLQQTSSGNPFGAANAFQPFYWNLANGSVYIDGTGNGTTFGGLTTFTNGATVTGGSFFSIGSAVNLSVSGPANFAQFAASGTANFSGNTNFLNNVSMTNPITISGLTTYNANTVFNNPSVWNNSGQTFSISTQSEIQSHGQGAGGQFRAIGGNYGAIFRNDGTTFYILATNSTTTPGLASWNGLRPFTFNLATGQVVIDGTGVGTVFGGGLTIEGPSTGVTFGNGNFIGASGTDISINTQPDNGLLIVSGSRSVGISNYGFLNNAGAGQSATATSYPVGLYVVNFIFAGAVFAFSDERIKSNITEIQPQEGRDFISKMKPIHYTYKDSGGPGAGFSAQQQIKAGYGAGISVIDDETIEESIDEEGFVSPKGKKFVKNYDFDNAYFVAFGKYVIDKLDTIERRLERLEETCGLI